MKLKDIKLKTEIVKQIMLDKHLGKENKITKARFLNKLLNGYRGMDELTQFFWNQRLNTAISALRKKKFFIVAEGHFIYVPTTMVELQPYLTRANNLIKGTQTNIENAKIFVKQKQWEDIQIVIKN